MMLILRGDEVSTFYVKDLLFKVLQDSSESVVVLDGIGVLLLGLRSEGVQIVQSHILDLSR